MKNLPDIPSYWLSLELADDIGHPYEECTAPALAAREPLLFYHQSEGNNESRSDHEADDSSLDHH